MIRMLPSRHTRCCLRPTLLLSLLLLLAAYSDAPAAAEGGEAVLPDADQVVEAYLTARQWTDTFRLPAPKDEAARLPLDGAAGVAVILRLRGGVVAMASVTEDDDTEHDLMVRRALGRALGQVLGHPAVTGLPDEIRGEVGQHLTLELEVAGRFEPLPGRSFRRVIQRLEPGVHGFAVRRRSRTAMLFPSKLRAANAADQMESRVTGLVSEIGLPPSDLGELIRDHGLSVYRFGTTHLAQREPDAFPFETVRGDRLVDLRDVTPESVRTMTDELAQHIMRRHWPGGETDPDHEMRDAALGLMGDYRAVSDRFSPLFAPPTEQALGAYVFSRLAHTARMDAEVRDSARDFARTLLNDLAVVEEGETDPAKSAVACAMIVLAWDELGEPPARIQTAQMIERARDVVVEQVNRALRRDSGRDEAGELPPPTFATAHDAVLIVAAAIRLERRERNLFSAEELRGLLDLIWQQTPEPEHVALFPWIVMAERELVELDPSAAMSREELRAVRALVEETRVTERDFDDERTLWDVRGGFALADPQHGTSRPTAQMTRPGVGFAIMLRDDRLTPESEQEQELERHRQSLRFLMQLSVRPELSWSYPNAPRARGGIRASLWNMDQPLAAQLMALLMLVETHETGSWR
ncbi:MAG: hypothetical protein EA377_12525 [Phycisphaerales bacterium]|nr:MAG: hypothetical protein EA377_12525 [Phycisphaerales bacterium]